MAEQAFIEIIQTAQNVAVKILCLDAMRFRFYMSVTVRQQIYRINISLKMDWNFLDTLKLVNAIGIEGC